MKELEKLLHYAEINKVRAEIVTPPALYDLQPDIGRGVRGVGERPHDTPDLA